MTGEVTLSVLLPYVYAAMHPTETELSPERETYTHSWSDMVVQLIYMQELKLFKSQVCLNARKYIFYTITAECTAITVLDAWNNLPVTIF